MKTKMTTAFNDEYDDDEEDDRKPAAKVTSSSKPSLRQSSLSLSRREVMLSSFRQSVAKLITDYDDNSNNVKENKKIPPTRSFLTTSDDINNSINPKSITLPGRQRSDDVSSNVYDNNRSGFLIKNIEGSSSTLFRSYRSHHRQNKRSSLDYYDPTVMGEEHYDHDKLIEKGTYRLLLRMAVFLVILTITITLVFVVLPNNKNDKINARTIQRNNNNNDSITPTTAAALMKVSSTSSSTTITAAIVTTTQKDRYKSLIESRMSSSSKMFDDMNSPQSKALDWMLNENNCSVNDEDEKWIQRFVLVTIYFSTDGPKWDKQKLWLQPNIDECYWNNNNNRRVSRSRHYHTANNEILCNTTTTMMEELVLNYNSFSLWGTIPSEIVLLSDQLQVLSMKGNILGGTIPQDILYQMTNLVSLQLSHNRLIGSIPTSDNNNNYKLISLSLGNNELTGSIPSTMNTNFPQLSKLDLHKNYLIGSVPSSLYKIKELYVNYNPSLEGMIPTVLIPTNGTTTSNFN